MYATVRHYFLGLCTATAVLACAYLFFPWANFAGATFAHAGLISFLSPEGDWGHLPRHFSSTDFNKNGKSDTQDLIDGARADIAQRPIYRSAYYQGGYPPDTEGVCTDVIWRAFKHAGYTLRSMVDNDIKAAPAAYPRVSKRDSNIDFRRVPNLVSYFKRHATKLTTAIKPGDESNLAQWQPGDIVTFTNPDHIAILSDKRNRDGIPFLLHNDGPFASESDAFMRWYNRGITGHFRFPVK